MNKADLEVKVREIVEPVIRSVGVELERLEIKKMARKYLMRVFIDKEGGVTLDDCEKVSREIEAHLDVENPVPYLTLDRNDKHKMLIYTTKY